jgi:hypothetical protein
MTFLHDELIPLILDCLAAAVPAKQSESALVPSR